MPLIVTANDGASRNEPANARSPAGKLVVAGSVSIVVAETLPLKLSVLLLPVTTIAPWIVTLPLKLTRFGV
ncbi:MAG TPA: hypothetical protein VK797_20050 [Tepidisphaeraceae bacterium]|nr:hypothetical protein [Tepidisphaeraceae bacterium]